MRSESTPRIGYVVKVYPRFSETFVVTEILAREALGEQLEIFALRPTTDTRFHGELSRVHAPVRHIERPRRTTSLWETLRAASADPVIGASLARHLDEILALEVEDAAQAISVAVRARAAGITHLHAHFATAATTVARVAALLADIPYSFTAHAKDLFHESVSHDDLARKLRDAAFAVTVSDFNLAHLRREFPAQSRVQRLYNGIDLARFPFTHPAPRSHELALLAVGRLVEKKGFSDLVDAVERVRDNGLPVRLEIVGEGELHDSLAHRIASSRHSHAMTLTGPLPQDVVALKLREADAFIAPCRIAADGNADGLPTVLLEAMATGTPCISTAVTGIPEIIRDGETGLLREPGDVDGLADAIAEVARAGFPAARIAAAARTLVEREFDATRQAARLSELTAFCLSERSAA